MIKNLFKKKLISNSQQQSDIKKNVDDYIELSDSPVEKIKDNKMAVFYCVLNDFTDIKKVLDLLRDGSSMCIIKIKPLKERDINELKRAISKVKRVCEVMEGDLVGMDEDYLIAHPRFIKICKGV